MSIAKGWNNSMRIRINKINLMIAFSLSALFLLSCSHRSIKESSDSDLFGPLEDMHISEEISYADSAFDGLIKDAFTNNKHYLNVINTGNQALLIRIHLIRMAKRSINIQTFIWGDDETEILLVQELFQAAERGVKINILIDALASEQDHKSKTLLKRAHPNIRVKYYNPIANKLRHSILQFMVTLITNFRKLNQRMHNKLFIVDDRLAITTGRNYHADYFDRGSKRNFQDRGCLVTGPVVKKMTDSFMDYWTFKWSVTSEDLIEAEKKNKTDARGPSGQKEILAKFEEIKKQAADYAYIKNNFTEKVYLVDSIKFIADGPGKAGYSRSFQSSSVADNLWEFISGAEKSIIIQTPYLILPRKAEKVFKQLRRKHPDIDVRVSTNSLSTTDNFMTYALSYRKKRKYLKKLRWRIFEFKHNSADLDLIIPSINPEEREKDYYACIHAKTFIVDNKKIFIGSFNIDPRSADLNTEAGLLIDSEQLAQDVAADILRAIAPQNSWTIGKHKKPPVVAQFSGILWAILRFIPIADIWPYTYSSSFELIQGKEELPFYHQDFYKHYKHVGLFPDMEGTPKSIKTRLFRAFFSKTTEPLL